MSGIEAEAARIDGVCRRKAAAEIALAEAASKPAGGVRGSGDVLAEVLLVKGTPGPADLEAREALAGEDGVAIGKALDALGMPAERYAFCTAGSGRAAAVRRRVRLMVEAVDPRFVVLLDAVAARDFSASFGVPVPETGVVTAVSGRSVIAVDDFGASLADESAKRRVWRQLRALEDAR